MRSRPEPRHESRPESRHEPRRDQHRNHAPAARGRDDDDHRDERGVVGFGSDVPAFLARK